LEKDPNNQRILLKLLSIYLDRKDPKTFNAIAQRVRASGDPAAWAQAAEMGRKLEPDNPEYSGEAGSGEVAKDIAREPVRHEPGAMGLDFDLDFEKEIAGTGANAIFELDKSAATESSALDFDLGADITEAGSEARAGIDDWTDKFSAGGDQAAHVETEHDFVDITSKSFPLQGADVVQPGAGEETAPAPEGFVDITSKSFPLQGIDVGMPYTGSESAPVADHFVDITSGAGVDSDKSNISGTGVPEQIDSLSFHGIDLNLNQPAAGISVAGGKNAHWNEVAVKIDLARAYQEIGDVVGAHEILKEVMDQGDDQQRAAAMAMLENMSA
jgi:pilus assembly protein FimV